MVRASISFLFFLSSLRFFKGITHLDAYYIISSLWENLRTQNLFWSRSILSCFKENLERMVAGNCANVDVQGESRVHLLIVNLQRVISIL